MLDGSSPGTNRYDTTMTGRCCVKCGAELHIFDNPLCINCRTLEALVARLERVQATKVEPDDVVIATVAKTTTQHEAALVYGELVKAFPHNKVVILYGTQLTVGRLSD